MMERLLLLTVLTLEETLAVLRRGGEQETERVVLWLGRREENCLRVAEVYEPEQETDVDYFRIPPAAMAALLKHLGESGTLVAAQVHSHPRRAFHSKADDTWAIVRHVGALSIVVPEFARRTTAATFLEDAAVFRLSSTNQWEQVPTPELQALLRVT